MYVDELVHMVANMTLYNDRPQDAISAQGRHSTDDQLGGDSPGYWALHHKALAQKAKAIVQVKSPRGGGGE